MPDWFEDEEFWSSWYPYVFGEERVGQAEQEVDQFLTLAGLKEGKVLDLACGPGRHAIELAKRGFQVTAVDRSPFLLSKAREKANTLGVDVEWVQEDMRSFERSGAFDLAINMFSAFGYFEDRSEDILVLQHLHSSLVRSGVLVIDTVGKEWLARHFKATSSSKEDDGTLLITRREIVEDFTRIRSEWIQLKDGEATSFESRINVYSGHELRGLLEDVGFGKVALYGDLEGNEYGIDVKRLIVVARK